jgi:hypothetical protein
MDLRARVLADCAAGLRTGAGAQEYTVSTAWVRRLLPRRRATGETQPPQGRPGPRPKPASPEDRLHDRARAAPDLSAWGYRDRLGWACSALTAWRSSRRPGLTFKKK